MLNASISHASNSALKIEEIKSQYGIKALIAEKNNSSTANVALVFKNSGYAYDSNDKQGLANLATLILQEGTKNKNVVDFSKELAKIGATISYAVDMDNFYIYIKVIPENLNQAIALLHDLLLYPKLDDETLKNVKNSQNSIREKISEDPYYIAKNEFFKHSFKNTPYANSQYGNNATLKNITSDDIKNYFSGTFNRINLSISAAGKIQKDNFINILDKYIIDLPLTVMNVKKIATATVTKRI